MGDWIRIATCGMAITLASLHPASAQKGRAAAKPKVKVQLLSSVEVVARGEAFDLGLQFQLEEGWHIYWKNSGDSGIPPKVTWSPPPDFEIGDLQFPVPKRNVAPGNIVTNVLGGQPVLLARVTPPASIDTDRVTIRVDLRFLLCNKTCIRESAKLDITLPIAAENAPSTPANESLFSRAKRSLPKTSSKYVTVSAKTDPANPRPGSKFEITVDVKIKPGFHLQSNAPLNPSFVATDVFLERADGLSFGEATYPAPSFRTIKYVGKVSEFAKHLTIHIPGEVDESSTTLPATLGGLLRYQACNDKGTCFPPEAVSFELRFTQTASTAIGEASTPEVERLVKASPVEPSSSEASPPPTDDSKNKGGFEGWLASLGIPGLLAMCFLYGLMINATPCVLPLLSIKVLGFVQQARESRSRTLMLGLSFGAGVMVFFVALGLLASQGKNVLQFPVAVIVLGTVVMAMALSMLGVFTLQAPTSATKLDAAIQKEGLIASFGKGTLAPVLGFACTAPMMAGGFAWATAQSQTMAILAFVFMGFGMASPYMLLGANPQWLSFLPKPGNWMITFERIMGFLLLGLVVLLIHPLVTHLGVEGLEWTLVFLVTVGMACWLLGQIRITMPIAQRWRYRGGASAIVLVSALTIYGWLVPMGDAAASSGITHVSGPIAWRPWSAEEVEKTVRAGNTVFVDFTAAYCTNCKINKKVAINTADTVQKIQDLGVVAFQGDFTSGDERIFQALQKHGRAGPPLDLIYPAGDYENPIVMSALFSQAEFLRRLDEAGPSQSPSVADAQP